MMEGSPPQHNFQFINIPAAGPQPDELPAREAAMKVL